MEVGRAGRSARRRAAPPIRLSFLPWVMRALPLIPLLQSRASSSPCGCYVGGVRIRRFARAVAASGGGISCFR